MSIYRQPIILFGIVIPILIGLAIVGIGYKVKSSMVSTYNQKLNQFNTNKQAKLAADEIKAQIERQREDLKRWADLTSQETVSTLSTNLKEISETLPGKEIQQTAFDPQNSSGNFGKASQQKSSQVRIAFRGTYRTLQKAFLQLETRMPQLQLDELKMEPMNNSPALISFQATYTAWEY